MNNEKHGVSVGIDRIGGEFFVSIKAIGMLTHEDYNVISPMLEAALIKVNQPKVNVLFDVSELKGWELRAAWDDFKLGLKHGSDFDKIALYGNRDWQEIVAKIGNWFISGDVKYFDSYTNALKWLKS